LYRRGRSPSKPKAWFEHSDGHVLRAEEALVKEFYPGLCFHLDADAGRMNLEGDFVLRTDCGVSTSIPIRLAFPRDYPESEPTAFDATGRFPVSADRHIIKDGQFCLWLPPCSAWDKDDPNRLRRFLDEVTVFLERQLIFDATGGKVWPGDQHKHGAAGYEEFMLALLDGYEAHLTVLFPVILGKIRPGRNEFCPCGSKRKYKYCHSDAIAEIVGRIGRRTLDYLYNKPKNRPASSGNIQCSAVA
jgi:SEC-C motif